MKQEVYASVSSAYSAAFLKMKNAAIRLGFMKSEKTPLTREELESGKEMRSLITLAAEKAKPESGLSEPIFNGDALYFLAYRLTIEEDKYDNGVYIDVHIDRLRSLKLREKQCYAQGANWREASHGLNYIGWDERQNEIVSYFKSELKDAQFPHKDAIGELELLFVGGVCICSKGVHRAIAAKCWLAYYQPENPILQQVYCRFRPIPQYIKKILSQCLEKNLKLFYFHDYHSKEILTYEWLKKENIGVVIKTMDTQLNELIYGISIDRSAFIEILPSEGIQRCIYNADIHKKCSNLDYTEISREFIEMLLDEEYIKSIGQQVKLPIFIKH